LRTTAQLLAILFLCFAGCWLLDRGFRSRPSLISGEVIDSISGQPAAFTDVRVDQLNFSEVVARTDEHGRFSFVASHPPLVYFVFAGTPRYNRLLQTTFGQFVIVYRPGEQISDVVVPAIRATELSGHVYAADGQPISSCDLSAITPDNRDLHVQEAWAFDYDAAQADDPNKFIEVDTEKTDALGSYTFKMLGADRYFILARCRPSERGEDNPEFSWEPMIYSQAASIPSGQEITLLPGEHRSGVDFHMHRKRSYSIQGTVLLSNGSEPKYLPRASDFHFLETLRSDRALTSTPLGYEACDWNVEAGSFRCDSLLPGTYTLYFGLGRGYNRPTQSAKVSYTVEATGTQRPLTVQLHNVPNGPSLISKTNPSGFLDTRKVCQATSADKPAIEVLAWGHGHAGSPCYYMATGADTPLSLPADTYTVNAFETAFLRRHYLGRNPKFEALLMQHGVPVHIRVGQTSEPELPVLTTKELIDIGLKSLQHATDRR